MTTRIGINGFGRIGRAIFKIAATRTDVEIVHINDLTSNAMLAHLLAFDSVQGPFGQTVKAVEGGIEVGGRFVSISAESDPAKLPWAEKKVDIVAECTGRFTSRAKAQAHITAGARKVIISAPGEEVDATVVMGVNHNKVDLAAATIISNASCTTNCLAPVAKVLNDSFGIRYGLMNTVHSYTMDQNLLDAPHKKDFRRARAAALNMVPTSTGAAKAVGLVLPELAGRLNGLSVRVPTPNVSMVDLVVEFEKETTVKAINEAFVAAAAGPLQGILDAVDAPLVSGDLNRNPHSSIVDLQLTMMMGKTCAKVIAWYDNEWAFSNRMLDLAQLFSGAGAP